MAQYTVTYEGDHAAAIQSTLDGINAARASEDPPRDPLTADAYLQSVLDSHVTEWVRQQDRTTFEGAWAKAKPEQKAAFVDAVAASDVKGVKGARV